MLILNLIKLDYRKSKIKKLSLSTSKQLDKSGMWDILYSSWKEELENSPKVQRDKKLNAMYRFQSASYFFKKI